MTLRATGMSVVLLAGVGLARADSGGPDHAGWTWADTDDGGAPFRWELPGGVLTGLGDGGAAEVRLPWAWTFYGWPAEDLLVHAHGAVTLFRTTPLTGANVCPIQNAGEYLIAAYWDDLTAGAGVVRHGAVGQAPHRRYVIAWEGVGHAAGPGDLSFEVKIFEADGRVELHYLDVVLDGPDGSYGATASVGVNGDGGVDVACNDAALQNSYAVTWWPAGACVDADFDGVCAGDDCDDTNAEVAPGAVEVPGNGVDDDCQDGDAPAGDDDDAGDDDPGDDDAGDDDTGDDDAGDDDAGDDDAGDDDTGDDDIGDDDAGDDDGGNRDRRGCAHSGALPGALLIVARRGARRSGPCA